MGDNEPELTPSYFRGVAERLREIASRLRFDLQRKAQILALADAFERRAERIERQPVKPR